MAPALRGPPHIDRAIVCRSSRRGPWHTLLIVHPAKTPRRARACSAADAGLGRLSRSVRRRAGPGCPRARQWGSAALGRYGRRGDRSPSSSGRRAGRSAGVAGPERGGGWYGREKGLDPGERSGARQAADRVLLAPIAEPPGMGAQDPIPLVSGRTTTAESSLRGAVGHRIGCRSRLAMGRRPELDTEFGPGAGQAAPRTRPLPAWCDRSFRISARAS